MIKSYKTIYVFCAVLILMVMNRVTSFAVSGTETESNTVYFETFEELKAETVNLPSGVEYSNSGWKSLMYNGTALNVVVKQSEYLDGQEIKLIPQNHSVVPIGGLYHESEIGISGEPLSISADIYLPEAKEGVRQIARFFVSRGTSEESVSDSEDIEVSYKPYKTASFGLSFDNKSGNSWNVYMMEPSIDNIYKETGIKVNSTQAKITGNEKISVECVYYPKKKMVFYYINGQQIASSTWEYQVNMENENKLGNIVIVSGSSDGERGNASFDNVKIAENAQKILSGDDVAYFSADTSIENANIDYVNATGMGFEAISLADEPVWKVKSEENKYVLFDISEDFGNSSVDGSAFMVEIEYYDIGEGYFVVWYDAINYGKQIGKIVRMTGDGEKKTARFEVEDARFLDDVADIMISLSEKGTQNPVSASDLYLSSVKVAKNKAKNPVLLESFTDAPGNTFKYFDSDKKITNIFTNTRDKDYALNVTYTLKDENGNAEYSYSESFIVPIRQMVSREINVDTQKCGLYKWYVDIKSSDGEIDSTFEEDIICIVKTDPDGIKNQFAWINSHIERYTGNEETCVELISMANVEGVRNSVVWEHYENEDGYDIKNTGFYDNALRYEQAGLKYWPMLYGLNTMYWEGSGKKTASAFPTTETQFMAWENFCRQLFIDLKNLDFDNIVHIYEIGNEPDLFSFNPTGATPADIARMAKIARKVADEVYEGEENPVLISGLGVTGLDWRYNTRKTEWLIPALEAGIADNGMDIMTLHTYARDTEPEKAKVYDVVKDYRETVTQMGGVANIPVLLSEYGYTTTDIRTNEQTKADWLTRSAILYKINGVGDMTAAYALEKKGILDFDVEDNFGMVSTPYEEYNIEGKVCVPTKSYLAYAGMNYVLGGELSDIEICDYSDNIRISKFKSEKFGKNILALWGAYNNVSIKLDLGVNQADFYDAYGNVTSMESDNGIFDISLTGSVTYIVSNNTKQDVVEVGTVSDITEDFDQYVSDDEITQPAGWVYQCISGGADGSVVKPYEVSDGNTAVMLSSTPLPDGGFGRHSYHKTLAFDIKNKPVLISADIYIPVEGDGSLASDKMPVDLYNFNIYDVVGEYSYKPRFGFRISDGKEVRVYSYDKETDVLNTIPVADMETRKWYNFSILYYPKEYTNGEEKVEYFMDGIHIYTGIPARYECEDIEGTDNTLDEVFIAARTQFEHLGAGCIFDNISVKNVEPLSVMNIKVVDSSGDELDGLSNMEVSLKGTVVNDGQAFDAMILGAAYDADGILEKSVIEKITIQGGVSEISSLKKFLIPSGCEKLKYFLWKKGTLEPFASVIEY